MNKHLLVSTIAALALAACSHGGDSTLPAQHSGTAGAGTTTMSAKSAAIATEEAAHAKMWQASKHPGLLPETASQPQWPAGVIESGLAPLPGAVYDITNQYHERVDGHDIAIFAGSLRETHEAIVVLFKRSIDGHSVTAPMVERLGTVGSARITGVSNDNLILSVGSRVVPFALANARAIPL